MQTFIIDKRDSSRIEMIIISLINHSRMNKSVWNSWREI